MDHLIVILRLSELAACITGLMYYAKWKKSVSRFFPFYLLFIVLAERIGYYCKLHDQIVTNRQWYNYVVIPLEFLFFFGLYYKAFNAKKDKRLSVAAIAVYIVCWVIDMLFLSNRQFWFYSFSYTIGNLLLLILIFRFFIGLVTTDAILGFRQNQLFWISSGLLIFYLGTFPYFGLLNLLGTAYPGLILGYRNIVLALNTIMYLLFTLSFIWGKPNTTYSSS